MEPILVGMDQCLSRMEQINEIIAQQTDKKESQNYRPGNVSDLLINMASGPYHTQNE